MSDTSGNPVGGLPGAYRRSLIVRWSDIDFLSHMKNTAYLDAAVDVRFLYFESHGLGSLDFSKLGIGPVVQRDDIEFYRELRFLVTGGNGDSAVRLRLEYADGRRASAEIPCVDWFKDVEDGLPERLVPAWNGMDRSWRGELEPAGDPALFELTLAVDGDAELIALELDPKGGRYAEARTRFNLLALTAMARAE